MAKSQVTDKYLACQHAPKTNFEKLIEEKPNWDFRYWAKVEKTDGCWHWVAGKNDRGYGVFSPYQISYKKPKLEYAHRISFMLAKGKVPVGHVVDHKCRNPACVNPSHLVAILHSENCAQGSKRKIVCSICSGVKRKAPNGRLVCRECANRRSRKYKRRKRMSELGF